MKYKIFALLLEVKTESAVNKLAQTSLMFLPLLRLFDYERYLDNR